jgi:hypothetical protein
MSLNKFPSTVGGEDKGFDLKLNIGCDTLKCNTINGLDPQEATQLKNAQIPSAQILIVTPELDLTGVYSGYTYTNGIKELAQVNTITAGEYQGQEKKAYALRNSQLTLKHNTPDTGATILCEGAVDITMYPTQPNDAIAYSLLIWDSVEGVWRARQMT